MARLIAGLSGGVDSAVAAARMIEAGHAVTGVYLVLSANHLSSDDAARVAYSLGIDFQVWDYSAWFNTQVVDYFLAEYALGRTPNPCLRCNQLVKFPLLCDQAMVRGFDGVITGHYARLLRRDDGIVELHRGVDPAKDQSYVLAVLTQQHLQHSYFPLGDSTKQAVRVEADHRGVMVANKPDSTDICFISDGDTAGYLRSQLGQHRGEIQDQAGQVLGHHQGYFTYTIGQRKGLAITQVASDGRPRYVLDIDPADNRVIVGPHDRLRVDHLDGINPTWCDVAPPNRFEANIQLRAHAEAIPARIRADNQDISIDLLRPVYGIAPGQTAVFYSGTQVIGSAVIDSTN